LVCRLHAATYGRDVAAVPFFADAHAARIATVQSVLALQLSRYLGKHARPEPQRQPVDHGGRHLGLSKSAVIEIVRRAAA
jgi:hypothetical protein